MFEQVRQLIDEKHRFLISGHVSPDGDCIGTQCALFHLLRDMGKDVTILNADAPEAVLDFLEAHTPFGVFRAGDELPEHDVHILTDCSTLARTGSVGAAARELEGVTRVVVDHHVGSDQGDGDLLLWDVTAPSAGSVVHGFYRELGAPISKAAAEGIFVSIVADTGWFRYSNTSREAFGIACELIDAGLEPHRIYDAIHRRNPASSVSLLADGLARAKFEADGKIAVLALDAEYCAKVRQEKFNTDALLDPLRSVDGVDVVALLKVIPDGKVKISLRANERAEVDGIARGFGGGGHKKAAGAALEGPLGAARERLVTAIAGELGVRL